MYRTIIRLKKDIAPEQLHKRTERIIDNFNNRAGNLENHSNNSLEFIFEGENEQSFNCIQLAIAELIDPGFMDFVYSWDWIDEEDPDDCCSVIDSYKKYYVER